MLAGWIVGDGTSSVGDAARPTEAEAAVSVALRPMDAVVSVVGGAAGGSVGGTMFGLASSGDLNGRKLDMVRG